LEKTALAHEKEMGAKASSAEALLEANASSAAAEALLGAKASSAEALLEAELQSSHEELLVVRGELDAAVASLATVTLERGVARVEVIAARRGLAALEKDMEVMVKQKDGINRFLESRIAAMERQAEAVRLVQVPTPAVAPVRGRGRGRGGAPMG
jgi:hypothetical protein